MPRLEWTVIASEPQSWQDASAAATNASAAKRRLPTQTELVEAITVAGDGGAGAFSFGIDSAVWTDEGGRVDPTSENDICVPGPAPTDAVARVVLVAEAAASQRPAAPAKQSLRVMGFLDDPVFQQCAEAATYLNTEYADSYHMTVEKTMGFEFERKRAAIAAATGNNQVHNWRVLVYNEGDKTAVSGDDFVAGVVEQTNFRLFDLPATDPQSYASLARIGLKNHLASTGSKFAWMLVKIDDRIVGRIVFQLYFNICPKTSLNFLHLCRGDLPDTKSETGEAVKLTYKGSRFYRVVKGGWIQGGDITGDKKGNGGMSIYGRRFPDESFDVTHDDAGTLGMANDGEHSNSSSFYITMQRSAWMNRRYVAFGRVVEGLNVVRAIHDTDVRHNQTPIASVVIDDCGDVPLDG